LGRIVAGTHPLTQLSASQEDLTISEVIFILGGPASGKRTQCQLLEADYKFKHLSFQDLLRKEVHKGGPGAQTILDAFNDQQPIPPHLAARLIRKAIALHGVRRYLIEGYLRSIQNWEAFLDLMKDEVMIKGLIFLDCSD
jgi:adenylate kinase family enzyme